MLNPVSCTLTSSNNDAQVAAMALDVLVATNVALINAIPGVYQNSLIVTPQGAIFDGTNFVLVTTIVYSAGS